MKEINNFLWSNTLFTHFSGQMKLLIELRKTYILNRTKAQWLLYFLFSRHLIFAKSTVHRNDQRKTVAKSYDFIRNIRLNSRLSGSAKIPFIQYCCFCFGASRIRVCGWIKLLTCRQLDDTFYDLLISKQ